MKNNKLFVYGILKRGYDLDLANYGATFLGEAHIEGATLYGIGPMGVGFDGNIQYHGVGLRLNTYPWSEGDPANVVAHGELWEIPGDKVWEWLDQIEQNGFCYTRKVVPVILRGDYNKRTVNGQPEDQIVNAWVYEHCYPDFKYENKIEGGRF